VIDVRMTVDDGDDRTRAEVLLDESVSGPRRLPTRFSGSNTTQPVSPRGVGNPCALAPSEHQTTNLGVGGSNPSGRATRKCRWIKDKLAICGNGAVTWERLKVTVE
jgi:hypothetical protein